MSFIKLKTAGETHTFDLVSVSEDSTGSWPDYHFTAATGEIVVVPKGAADRQLEFVKAVSFAELVGQKLTVSRSTKLGANGKPFWNIDRAGANDVTSQPVNGKPPVASAPEPEEGVVVGFALLVSRYDECVDAANKAWGGDMPSEALVAAAATLFIERNKRGI